MSDVIEKWMRHRWHYDRKTGKTRCLRCGRKKARSPILLKRANRCRIKRRRVA